MQCEYVHLNHKEEKTRLLSWLQRFGDRFEMGFIVTDPFIDNAVVFVNNKFTNMTVSVMAEGIEHKKQIMVLRSFGCEIGQGFYFHKPMPLREINKLQQ
ncbi:hypothetical protein [Sporosarcina sp. G11-34]|uniref:hypothetical protein n=1 Tax=Sporosarcina sp. G11-34 TaxID=2849605 RepID=UPI0022A9240A|nr:hypothetical protein [Sporosarcina sp. G11-34]MCZ2258706.1 EAL domain-containing protein [Sporosarcina sp. G11-34]